MEGKERKKGAACGWWCSWCGCHCATQESDMHHHHGRFIFYVLRILIAIVILAIVFAVGIKLGELRAYLFEAGFDGYGYPMHMYGGYGGYGGGPYGAPMMPYNGNGAQNAAPATTSAAQ